MCVCVWGVSCQQGSQPGSQDTLSRPLETKRKSREREPGRRRERRRERRSQNKTKKTWGHKSVGEAFRSHAGSWAREKPNCPLWHKSHSVRTGCCLRDVPDPSALHCRVCVLVHVRACLARCWLSGKGWRRTTRLSSLSHVWQWMNASQTNSISQREHLKEVSAATIAPLFWHVAMMNVWQTYLFVCLESVADRLEAVWGWEAERAMEKQHRAVGK